MESKEFWNQRTISTYDNSAPRLAEFFEGIGPRIVDIELALELSDTPEGTAKVVEIGCGDGRDAEEIIKRTASYEGFDPSKGMLEISKAKNLNGTFVQADALSYEYPPELDVVYSFASLLHSNISEVEQIIDKVSNSLREGGIFYISLKHRDKYEDAVTKDKYGERMFYYYNPETITELSKNTFEPIYEDHQTIGKTDWFTLALRKI